MSLSLSDAKRNNLQAKLVTTVSNNTDLEWNYYSANSGLAPASKFSISDHKRAFYLLKGATGASLPALEVSYFKSRASVGNSWHENALDFYLNRTFL